MYSTGELVDAAAGFSEALVSGCCPLTYCEDEAIGDGVCGVSKVATLVHAEDSFS